MNLQLGDSLDLLKQLPDESVDLIVTDPPYRTISGGKSVGKEGLGKHGRPTGMLINNDGKIFEHNNISFASYLPELFRVLRDQSHLYLMVNFFNLEEALREVRKAGFGIHNLLIWEKNNVTPNRWYMKNAEYVIFARKGAAVSIHNKGSKTCHAFRNVSGKSHPTEKPVDLLAFYIQNSSLPGDLILDPFMGTGSTGAACRNTGRRFIGMELDETYFHIAHARLQGNGHEWMLAV